MELVTEVIVSLYPTGDGTAESPKRDVLMVMDKCHQYVAEYDPTGMFSLENLYDLEKFIKNGRGTVQDYLKALEEAKAKCK